MNSAILIAVSLLGLLEARAEVPSAGGTHYFWPVPVPVTTEQKNAVQVSPKAMWFGDKVRLAYHPLFQTGTPVGDSAPFATLHDAEGRPIMMTTGQPRLCNGLDGATLLQAEGALYSVVHAECHPGALQLSRLTQEEDSGALKAVSTTQVDLRAVGGGNLFCAGETTAWGTHLAAEEFESDASKLQPDGTVTDDIQYYNTMRRYWGDLSKQSPYQLGWIDELSIVQGSGSVAKRYAMGRFSHEQARVMPDRRTVYLSDDGTNSAFFVFVADAPGDLRSGHLYASRWRQAEDAETFGLEWVSLGHAHEDTIAQAVQKRIRFEDLFEVQDVPECTEGFQRIRTTYESRCLRVRPGMEVLASRLESRRVAALRGGTTEFRKWEGMAIDAEKRRVYGAISMVANGMVQADPQWDLPSADHIRMKPNSCGMVMALDVDAEEVKDTDGQPIDSEWIVQSAQALVAGVPEPPTEAGVPRCAMESIANPDNLAFIPEADLLLIAEDTHGHDNNVLWSMDLTGSGLTRILTAPTRAEVAGLNWFSDIGGFGYLTVTIQFSDSDWMGVDEPAEVRMSTSGVIGPFPRP